MPSLPVAITGLGAVSALGVGVEALREAIDAGRDGLREMHRFDCAPFAPVRLFGAVPPEDAEARCEAWAARAAREAFDDAAVSAPAERVAVVAGTTEGDESVMWGVADAVAEAIGARGPRLTVSTACTSSANAIGLGRDLLARGEADVVIAGGAERLVPEMVAGFSQLGVLTAGRCSPFGEHVGTTLGEGAGFVVLERAPQARVRGWLLGYGLSSDAWHETSPHPRGEGIERAMRGCLSDAGLTAEAIDYVNAHATGTAANDPAEWSAIERVLGEVAVSGSKCFFGHAQGAAGALELIATLVCLERGAIPQTLRVGAGRARGPSDPVAQDHPRPHFVGGALCHSAAFGGANAILALSPSSPASTGTGPRRDVFVRGVGLALDRSASLPLDLRGCDASARLVVAAAHTALADAGVRVRGALRDRAGIFGGARRVSFQSGGEFNESVDTGGLGRVSATAFARLVMHAPSGAAARLLALRGPTTTLADDEIAGLLAAVLASDRLAHADDAELLLACGFEEAEAPGAGDGAACVAFGVAESEVRVLGTALGASGDEALTADRALAQAGLERAALRLRVEASSAPSFESARALVRAVSALREGAASALVVGASSHASAAIVLARVC